MLLKKKSAEEINFSVLYDEMFFLHVFNYYRAKFSCADRFDFVAFHEIVRSKVAEAAEVDIRSCRLAEPWIFNRYGQADRARCLGGHHDLRGLDEQLSRAGVVQAFGLSDIEATIASVAEGLSTNCKLNVLMLFTGSAGHAPLAHRLKEQGTRVMVPGWHFTYQDAHGVGRETHTAQALVAEADYYVDMTRFIGDPRRHADTLVREAMACAPGSAPDTGGRCQQKAVVASAAGDIRVGTIHSTKEAFGWIAPEQAGNNEFFHRTAVLNTSFEELHPGDVVTYHMSINAKGPIAVDVELVCNEAMPQGNTCENSQNEKGGKIMHTKIQAILPPGRLMKGGVVRRDQSKLAPRERHLVIQECKRLGYRILERGNQWLIFRKDRELRFIV